MHYKNIPPEEAVRGAAAIARPSSDNAQGILTCNELLRQIQINTILGFFSRGVVLEDRIFSLFHSNGLTHSLSNDLSTQKITMCNFAGRVMLLMQPLFS